MYSEQEGSNRQEPANSGESRDLSAARSPRTSAIAARSARLRLSAFTSGEGCGVVGLKAGEGRIEHFPAGYQNQIQPRRRLVFPEQLAGEALGPVPHDSGAEFSCGGDTKPAPRAAVGRHEQGHEPARQSHAVFVRLLELGTTPDAFMPGKTLRHRALDRLPLVRDGQPLPALCAAALQHDAAVLRRHPYPEAVRLATAPCIGLKRALPLCHCDCVLHELNVENASRQTPNTSRRSFAVSKRGAMIAVCYSSRASRRVASMLGLYRSPFGLSPKISTPVENTVEKQEKWQRCRRKWPIYGHFRPGESP